MSKYDIDDIENLMCICEEDTDKKCQKAVALSNNTIRITADQKSYLQDKYSNGMDEKVMYTLNRVMGM